MASATTQVKALRKGEAIEGVVTKLTPKEILIDIGAKTEAVVLEKDKKLLRSLLSSLKIGDKVTVSVLNPESDFGYPVVSLRRFLANGTWDRLATLVKQQKAIPVRIQTETRAGFLVDTPEGISGFLPTSQLLETPKAGEMTGKTINAYVLDVNRATKKVIFSQKPTVTDEEFGKAIQSLRVGTKVEGVIANFAPFGIFVSLPVENNKYVDGLIHISEVSWDKVSHPQDLYNVGDSVSVSVIGIDKDAKRVELSIKQLTEDPYKEALKTFAVDQKLTGKVKEVSVIGALIDLGKDGVEGLIRKEKIPVGTTYKEGDSVSVTVVEVDTKRRRIVLAPVLTSKFVGYR